MVFLPTTSHHQFSEFLFSSYLDLQMFWKLVWHFFNAPTSENVCMEELPQLQIKQIYESIYKL